MSTVRAMRKRTSILATTTVAVVLAGCGSSGPPTVTPSSYVRAVCTAVGPFEKDVVSRSSALNLATINNAPQGKTALRGFLTAVASDTRQALSKLNAAGTPNVKNGKQISSA